MWQFGLGLAVSQLQRDANDMCPTSFLVSFTCPLSDIDNREFGLYCSLHYTIRFLDILAIPRQGSKAVGNLQPPTLKFHLILVFYCIFNKKFFPLQQSPSSLPSLTPLPLPTYDFGKAR